MTEQPTTELPEPSHHRSWVTAATCSALVLLVTMGGVLALRDQLLAQSREERRAEASEREKLTRRVDSLQSALDTLANQPKPESAAVDTLASKLTETNHALEARLEALTTRLDQLEKQAAQAAEKKVDPAPVAPAPAAVATPAPQADLTSFKLAVLSGKPFTAELTNWAKQHPETEATLAPLTEIAATGLVSEAELSRRLLAALEEKPQAIKAEDTSLMGKINTHLKGLVSIKKSAENNPYAAVRKAALREDVATLQHLVEQLNEADRAPLAAWLTQAQTRSQALHALEKLTPKAGE